MQKFLFCSRKKVLLTLCFLFFQLIALKKIQAQENFSESFGGNLSLSFRLGTKLNAIGLVLQGFYYREHIQVNGNLRLVYNFNTFVPKKSGFEIQSSLGLLICLGEVKDSIQNPFLHSLSNQTGREYSFGYAINLYLDQIKTSQPTGTIALQYNRFQFLTENDILGRPSSDRYRTAGVLFLYRFDDYQIGLNTLLWTGNPTGSMIVRDSNYPSKYGYVDMKGAKYGNFSTGIMSLQIQYVLPYQQIAQANIGLDSEWIRHFWQNRLIHDMYFIPAKLNPAKNPHIPMVDTEGNPYLYEEGQKVRRNQFYFNLGLNQSPFY